MMHTSPLLFRLAADCTLELPVTRTISMTHCCYRDDLRHELNKDFCRFHHLEPAEINPLPETPLWYPKPINLTTNVRGSKYVPYDDTAALKPIYFKHMLTNVKDYLNKFHEHFMSEERHSPFQVDRATLSSAANPTENTSRSQSGSVSQQGFIASLGDWPQNLAAGVQHFSPSKISAFVKSVWHGFEVMGLTEDNTVG